MRYEVKLYTEGWKNKERYYEAKRFFSEYPSKKELLEFFLQYFYKHLKQYHQSEEIESSSPTITKFEHKHCVIYIDNTRKNYSYGSQSYHMAGDSYIYHFEIMEIYEENDKECYSLSTHQNTLIRNFVKQIVDKEEEEDNEI